jgi:hypothetical protein
LGGVVAERGVGDGDAGGVKVVSDLGESIALIAEVGDFGFQLVNSLSDGVRSRNRRGECGEAFTSLIDSVRREGGAFRSWHLR